MIMECQTAIIAPAAVDIPDTTARFGLEMVRIKLNNKTFFRIFYSVMRGLTTAKLLALGYRRARRRLIFLVLLYIIIRIKNGTRCYCYCYHVSRVFHLGNVTSGACLSYPCRNGATCYDYGMSDGYYCTCPSGYTGHYCEEWFGDGENKNK